jgi:type I restriction enzyme S subunit
VTVWPVVPLGEVADTALGKMLDKGRSQGLPHVPYLRNVNVQWGRIDTADLLTMELADDERNRFGVEPGDLLVCEGGEVGRCAIWRGASGSVAFQKALHRIRPGHLLDTAFLRYFLEHQALSGGLQRLTTGSTIAHLPQQQLRRVPVPLPPVDEQRRIVAILEDHLSRLNAARAYLENGQKRLARLEQVALANARDGQLVPLPEVTAIQGGIQKQQKRAPRDNPHPFLRVANVTSRGLDLDAVHSIELFDGELAKYRLEPGDLLVVEGNGSASQIGRAAIWDGSIPDCVHQNHLIRVRPLDTILPEYLEVVWNSPQSRAALTAVASSSSGLHTLSVSKLKALAIPVPDLQRQRELVAQVDAVRQSKARLSHAVDDASRRHSVLRQALLAAAFSGRLAVSASGLSEVERRIGA